jgi:hypothetical protein
MSVKSATARGLTSGLEPAMVLLNTTSFNAVASQALPANTFSATYENYHIIFKYTATTADNVVYMKMRASGTDSSAGYYLASAGTNTSGTNAPVYDANITNGFYIITGDTGSSAKPTYATFNLFNPFIAQPTSQTIISIGSQIDGTTRGFAGGGLHTASTSYDTVNFVASAGNISGSITVYGVNQ